MDNAYDPLLKAARDWRESIIPGTSSSSYGPMFTLLAELAKHDPEPCQHPREWRVFRSRKVGTPPFEQCAKCAEELS